MKKSAFLILVLFSQMALANSKADTDFKQIASEMTVMTRTMDALFAREEMKDSVVTNIVHGAFHAQALGAASPEIDRKVALLTSGDSINECQTSFTENKSPTGDKDDAVVHYNGANCPFDITATIHIASTATGSGGDVDLVVKITSDKIKQQIDMTVFDMPMKIDVTAGATPTGFGLTTTMKIAAKVTSQKYGLVDYTADTANSFIFGQTSEVDASSTEVYSSGGQDMTFRSNMTNKNGAETDMYSINNVAVTKPEFDKQHAAIALPGMDNQTTPLTTPEACGVVTYDSAVYSLDTVRKNIQAGTADSMKAADTYPNFAIAQTGKADYPLMFSGQNINLEINVTADAARFDFQKPAVNGAAPESVGRLTAVLGDKVELTKVVLDRVVRITCNIQK